MTGRPVLTDSSASSTGPKSGRWVIANVPRPRSASGSASRISSSTVASRLGTGLPQAPAWAGWREDAKPMAPESMASPTSRRISSISALVASRSTACWLVLLLARSRGESGEHVGRPRQRPGELAGLRRGQPDEPVAAAACTAISMAGGQAGSAGSSGRY